MPYVDIIQITVDIDHDGDCYSCFSSRYGDTEQAEKHTLHLFGIQVAVENTEIYFNRVKYQLYRDQHSKQILPRNKSVDSRKKHDGTHHQIMLHWYHHNC